jgi:hypothetical protein
MSITTILPMQACIPVNNSLTGPLGPIIKLFEGGIGGLLIAVVALLMLIAVFNGVIHASRGGRLNDAMARVINIPVVLIGGIIIIALFVSLFQRINQMC